MPDNHTIVPKPPASRSEQQPELKKPDTQGERSAPQELSLAALQRQFSNISSEVGELTRLVRGGAREAVSSAVDRADDVRHDTAERAQELEKRAVEWVRERPLEAALISMGVGALLWSLLRRS